jgi:hypothetical protein
MARCGIGYDVSLRARVEAVCFRRELAYARKLPGEHGREKAQDALAIPHATWADTAARDHVLTRPRLCKWHVTNTGVTSNTADAAISVSGATRPVILASRKPMCLVKEEVFP